MGGSSDQYRRSDIDAALLDGLQARLELRRVRLYQSFGVSMAVTVLWLLAVSVLDLWARVGQHGVAAITMIFGSFVAGATPQGGGAVAFPVFTKALDVPTEVARSFSLCIQAVGMGTAALSIIINRRQVEWRAALSGAIIGSASLIATLYVIGDRSVAFWPTSLPAPYVKVTFTLVVLATGAVVLLGSRVPIRAVSGSLPPMNKRLWFALALSGAIGGVASALVGSGADVLIYLFVVVLFGVRADVGVPTSVLAMAAVSVVGFVVVGLIDGQLMIALDAEGRVSAVGGELLERPLPARQADLLGMWLAAVPVVTWGAPLGAWVSSRMSTSSLVRFALVLSALEVVSTLLFLEPLRRDRMLQATAIAAAIVIIGGLVYVASQRRRLFGLPDLDLTTLLTRETTEVSPTYRQEF